MSKPFEQNKSRSEKRGFYYNGERVGIRTRDPLIKSQMLYQLSYAPMTNKTQLFETQLFDNVEVIYKR